MGIPAEILRFACVPVAPERSVKALEKTFGPMHGPVASRLRWYATMAAREGNADLVGQIARLHADTAILAGDFDAALAALADGPDILEVRVRRAVAVTLSGGGDAALRQVFHEARKARQPLEMALTGLLLAREMTAFGAQSRIRQMLEAARLTGDLSALCRLGLIAADAYLIADEPAYAITEVVRSLNHAAAARDRELERHAKHLLEHLQGGSENEGLDELIRVALDLGHETDLGGVLDQIARSTLDLTGAERAFVVLNEPEGPRVAASAYLEGHSGLPSLTIAEYTLREGKEMLTTDVGELSSGAAESIQSMQLRMVLCIPMSDRVRVMGAIYADSQRRDIQHLEKVAWLVRAFAAHATVALRNAELTGGLVQANQLAREIVHDVRNLAGGMGLGLGELRDLPLPPWAQEVVQDLEAMNAMLLKTVEPLLSREDPELVRVQLDGVFRRAAALMRFEARTHGVEFVLTTVDAEVFADESGLARVAANLLGNALKYSPEGGRVHVQMACDAEAVRLTVRDEGPGIPSDALEVIFDTGVQAHGAKKGFGLGLGICSKLVRQAGGKISARNHPDGGAVFEVELPLA